MSEELGVKSEELVRSLRSCADCCGKCSECAYERHEDCAGDMKRDAADEIERLTKERDVLLAVASNVYPDLCMSCDNNGWSEKCSDGYAGNCEDCGRCPCSRCRDGSEWVWNEKGE